MSINTIVGGWSALKADLHHATELFGRSAGPDGAIDRIKHGLSEVVAKFEKLAVEEAAKVAATPAPVVEAPVVEAPVVEAPVVEAPVVEAPVVEAPVVEAVEEAPADEAPATTKNKRK